MFALRNLYRRKARSGLTILGIAVCIASVVALIAVTGGFRDQTNQMASAGQSDLVVSQAGAADPTWSYLPPGTVERLEGVANVSRVHPVVLSVNSAESRTGQIEDHQPHPQGVLGGSISGRVPRRSALGRRSTMPALR